jgi:hypothetical protein
MVTISDGDRDVGAEARQRVGGVRDRRNDDQREGGDDEKENALHGGSHRILAVEESISSTALMTREFIS